MFSGWLYKYFAATRLYRANDSAFASIFALLLQDASGSRMSAAMEGIKHPDLSKFLVIAAILFIIGVAGVLVRRNIIVIFMSIELILNAANLNFIAFSRYLQTPAARTRFPDKCSRFSSSSWLPPKRR